MTFWYKDAPLPGALPLDLPTAATGAYPRSQGSEQAGAEGPPSLCQVTSPWTRCPPGNRSEAPGQPCSQRAAESGEITTGGRVPSLGTAETY